MSSAWAWTGFVESPGRSASCRVPIAPKRPMAVRGGLLKAVRLTGGDSFRATMLRPHPTPLPPPELMRFMPLLQDDRPLERALRAARDTKFLAIDDGVRHDAAGAFRSQFGDVAAVIVADERTFEA